MGTPLPPPIGDRPLPQPPSWPERRALVGLYGKLVAVMAVAAVVMAVLPVPPGAIAIVVLGLPVFAAVVFYSAITNRKWADRFRYTGALVRDGRLDARQRGRAKLAATRTEFKRSMLMLGLFLAVFVAGLVLGGLAVGINEAIYGVSG